MNAITKHDEASAVLAAPPGMLEYSCRTAIRDLIRLHGFEAAREMIADYIERERTGDRK